jgi:hypothetical protein
MLLKFKIMKRIKLCILFSVICFVFCLKGQAQTVNDTLLLQKISEEFLKFENEISKDSTFSGVFTYYTILVENKHNLLDYKKDSIYVYKEATFKNFMAYIRKKYCR